LLTTSVAAFKVAEAEAGFKPDLYAGHSLGEYSALVAAGAFRLSDAVVWVHKRGQFMQKAVPQGEGKMAAVIGLPDPVVVELCIEATRQAKEARKGAGEFPGVEALVEPANFNSPGQIVISGSSDAIALAITIAQSHKGKAILLEVSAPFIVP